MATSEQLEREAEATRAQIAAMLDELRGRITPGELVDQLLDYTRDSGGAEFFRNFGRQVVGNPIPVTLVGAGLAWLMMAGRAPTMAREGRASGPGASVSDMARRMGEGGGDAAAATRDEASATVADLSEHARRRAHDWARQTRDTAAQLNRRAGEAGARLQDTAAATGASVRDAASTAYDAVAGRSREGADAIAGGARAMSHNVAATGRGISTFLQEQPLVLAGLGLAIGGLLGASLPMTDAEDQLMGEASDAAKREAKDLAAEQLEKGKAVAAEAWNAAKPEIDQQLHRNAEAQGGLSGEAHAGRPAGQEATLVPSDEAGQGETAGERARREAEHPSG